MSAATVITTDPAGRITGYQAPAQDPLGFSADELLGKERVSIFFPGLVVLGHLPGWLAQAAEGSFETETVLLDSDRRPQACRLRIQRLGEEGPPQGFQVQAEALPGRLPDEVSAPMGPGLQLARWLVIMRVPFLTATLVPVLVGGAAAAWADRGMHWTGLLLALLSAALLHLGANTSNDYFDWRSGADAANKDYIPPFSGGSRSIQLGLITPGALLALSLGLFALGGGLGLWLAFFRAPALLWVGLAGALLGFFYTAPPLRLCARRGLGEVAIFAAFGPLLSLAGWAAATGDLHWQGALAGVPLGLWTAGILWVNQIPDVEGDRASGKYNLVATLGRRGARPGLPLLLGGGYLSIAILWAVGQLPLAALGALVGAPLLVIAVRELWRHWADDRIQAACAATIRHQLVSGLGLALGICLAAWLS